MPREGSIAVFEIDVLTRQAASASLHCLAECSAGEVLGTLAADTVSIATEA